MGVYYTRNGLEAITVIEKWELNFSLGNAIKYICRAGRKDNETYFEDLEKALWYIRRELGNAIRTDAERASVDDSSCNSCNRVFDNPSGKLAGKRIVLPSGDIFEG